MPAWAVPLPLPYMHVKLNTANSELNQRVMKGGVMFEPNPNRVRAEVRVMWPGGPSRRWSKTRTSEASMPYGEDDGYVGSYMCQGCGEPTVGLQRVICRAQGAGKWFCAACRDAERSKEGGATEHYPVPEVREGVQA